MVDLRKICKHCSVDLTEFNIVKNGTRNGIVRYKKECKPCYSKNVIKLYSKTDAKRCYARNYLRKIGKVKEYPCQTCAQPCYKKYAKAFCSDKCRFLSYVDKQEYCWIWKGATNRRRYGKFCFKENKTDIASRVSYELFVGPIESGKFICHECDIPLCVNPDHLWVGSHVENMMDMVDKGRQYSRLNTFDVVNIRKMWDAGMSQGKIMEKFNKKR